MLIKGLGRDPVKTQKHRPAIVASPHPETGFRKEHRPQSRAREEITAVSAKPPTFIYAVGMVSSFICYHPPSTARPRIPTRRHFHAFLRLQGCHPFRVKRAHCVGHSHTCIARPRQNPNPARLMEFCDMPSQAL